MGVQVREERLDDVRDDALRVLAATRQVPVPPERFDWLYRRNPDGPAVCWSVRDDATDALVGFTVALPRRMRVDGAERTCWNGADFSMLPKYCTLGPSLKLRRAAKDGIDAGRADFLYAHPNAKMQLIHERVGHFPIGTMVRYALPLRLMPYLGRRLGRWERFVPGFVGSCVDAAYRLCGTRHRPTTAVRCEAEATFGEEFDGLFEETAADRSIVGVRDRKYLTWRYRDNPLEKHVLFTARANGRLRGYAVCTTADDLLHLKDLVAAEGPVRPDLLKAVRDWGQRRGLHALSTILLEGHPLEPDLARFGFVRRPETSNMFGYAPPESPLRSLIAARESWYLSVGDRDV